MVYKHHNASWPGPSSLLIYSQSSVSEVDDTIWSMVSRRHWTHCPWGNCFMQMKKSKGDMFIQHPCNLIEVCCDFCQRILSLFLLLLLLSWLLFAADRQAWWWDFFFVVIFFFFPLSPFSPSDLKFVLFWRSMIFFLLLLIYIFICVQGVREPKGCGIPGQRFVILIALTTLNPNNPVNGLSLIWTLGYCLATAAILNCPSELAFVIAQRAVAFFAPPWGSFLHIKSMLPCIS